jgi:Ca2+-binding RTX toxin-like protein
VVGGDRIEIDGSAHANDVSVTSGGIGRYRISDGAGITGCAPIDAQTTECESEALRLFVVFDSNGGGDRLSIGNLPVETHVTALGGDGKALGPGGSDRFALAGGVSESFARFSGNAGRDVLIGGSNYDFLSGGDGRDEVRGLAGPDRLLGGRGLDLLIAGPGDDKVQADDSGGEESIRCGPGDDVAVVDREEARRTSGCETVKTRG